MGKPRWDQWPASGSVYALPYGRLSEDDADDKSLSPETQRDVCAEHIGRHGWIPGEWRFDLQSGFRSRPEDRKSYQALLADVRRLRKAGRDVCVVVKQVDRFGRRLSEMARAFEELDDMGARIYTTREGTYLNFLQAGIQGTVAEQESRNTGDRVRDIIEATRRNGWWFPGKVPWGYRAVPAT